MRQSLTNIDTSFWKIKDKEWKAEREASWPRIESMLSGYKKKKGLNVIKAYYLKGKMPNWKAMREWTDETRHVDLFVFLWLHPSWDRQFLKELRDAYVNSSLITRWDLLSGFDTFLDSQTVPPTMPMGPADSGDWPYLNGHGELLFEVMFDDPVQTEYELPPLTKFGKKQIVNVKCPGLRVLLLVTKWLSLSKQLEPLQREFLFQYSRPLDWWYESVKDLQFSGLTEFDKIIFPHVKEALAHIHQFDIDKEGDTCRTQFVVRMRKILDERPFFDEFETIWRQVNSGEIRIDNALES